MTTKYPRAEEPPKERGQYEPEHSSGHGHHTTFPVKLRLFDELKRRNVFRVAILYLIVCWLILDPTHVVFVMLGVPEWANRLVVVFMAIGLPLVLLFSWVYEVTPEGLRPTAEVDPGKSITRKTGQKLNQAIMVSLAVAVVVLLTDKFWLSRRSNGFESPQTTSRQATGSAAVPPTGQPSSDKPVAVSDKSIAVLPFVDMSEKKDQEYFSDGLSEELIDRLAHSPDLRVIARTSCFFFKGKQTTIGEIARTLGVSHVLEGSVRRSGQVLRVTAQLIRASDGSHLWSETYDRKAADIFKVQDDIADTVAHALKAALRASPAGGRTRAPSQEAYNLVLQGNYFFNRGSDADWRKSIELYAKATRVDPAYALAWAKLARATDKSTSEGRAKALQAARRAVGIDADLAYGHYVLGRELLYFEWDWPGAKTELERAIELDPDFLSSRVELSYLTKGMFGDFDEKIRYLRQIVTNDPLDAYSLEHLGGSLLLADRFEEAAATFAQLVQLNPAWPGGYTEYGESLMLLGKTQEAMTAVEKEPDETSRQLALSLVYWDIGKRAESDAALGQLRKEIGSQLPAVVASVYAFRGQKDAAFDWLERAYKKRGDPNMALIMVDPLLRNLHGDPRFKAMLVKMKIAE